MNFSKYEIGDRVKSNDGSYGGHGTVVGDGNSRRQDGGGWCFVRWGEERYNSDHPTYGMAIRCCGVWDAYLDPVGTAAEKPILDYIAREMGRG